MSRWLLRLDQLRARAPSVPEPQRTRVHIVQNVQNLPAPGTFEHFEQFEHAHRGRPAVVPREWTEGCARLCAFPHPAAIPPARWRELVDNAGRFLERWGGQAAALGWSTADIFGCHREAPLARYDLQGLVFIIGSGEVVATTALSATIRTRGGATQTFRRTPPPTPGEHVAAIWELCVEPGGASNA
jgi:hypothetical protein